MTVIELLSPANKTSGHPGREKYRTKQQEMLNSRVHLLEIDLLRRGEHTVAAPLPELEHRGRWDYPVCLHRSTQRWQYEVRPVQLRDRLPQIHVPLAGEDPDVILDFQAVFDRFYDENAYARLLDYRQDPTPPLGDADRAWAEALLRERGLRQ